MALIYPLNRDNAGLPPQGHGTMIFRGSPCSAPVVICVSQTNAGVAEWQTRMVQVHVGATP